MSRRSAVLWICKACTCRYSVGAPRCPQCGSTDHQEAGAPPDEVAPQPVSRKSRGPKTATDEETKEPSE
jgi:hypothetical protein